MPTVLTERWRADGTGRTHRRGRISRPSLNNEVEVVADTLAGLPTGGISLASLRTALAAPTLGDNSTMRSRVSITDVGGTYGKALTITLPDSDEGVVFQPPLPEAFVEGYIEYDLRWRTGFPFGKGGKLPGLGGFRSPLGAPPSGGNPSPYGWAGRPMWLGDSWGGTNGIGTELIAYPYLPWLAAGSFGKNRLTGYSIGAEQGISNGAWRRIRVYYKMNSVTSEGLAKAEDTGDGLHDLSVDGTSIFNKTNEVWRFYSNVKISHWSFAVFYGGDETWSGGGGIIDIANLRVVKVA